MIILDMEKAVKINKKEGYSVLSLSDEKIRVAYSRYILGIKFILELNTDEYIWLTEEPLIKYKYHFDVKFNNALDDALGVYLKKLKEEN